MAQTLAGMPIERAWVVHGAAGWDEATPIGPFIAFDVTAAARSAATISIRANSACRRANRRTSRAAMRRRTWRRSMRYSMRAIAVRTALR